MFKNWDIREKLLVAFITMAIITAITSSAGLYFNKQVGDAGIKVGVNDAPLADASLEI